jgi:hypothetical protein
MRLHAIELARRQLAWLAEDGVIDADLTDVVERRADLQLIFLERA